MSCSHSLAGADIKRNVWPAPVINVQFKSGESLGLGVGSHAGLLAISEHTHAFDLALAVLSADAAVQNAFSGQRLDRVQDFCLLIAHRISMKRIWRFHCGK